MESSKYNLSGSVHLQMRASQKSWLALPVTWCGVSVAERKHIAQTCHLWKEHRENVHVLVGLHSLGISVPSELCISSYCRSTTHK